MHSKTKLPVWRWTQDVFKQSGRVYIFLSNVMESHSALYFKASNLQCHFSSLHANDKKFPKGTELRKHKLIPLKSQAEKQIQLFQKCTKHSETDTLCTHRINWLGKLHEHIAKHASVMLKSCLPEINKLKRMVSDIQMSHHTVEHRISDINMAIALWSSSMQVF